MYRRGENEKHDRVLDGNKLTRRGVVVLDHVRQAGVGHNTTQLIDWCWVMSRRWAKLDPAEARAYRLTAEWLEAIYIGGECSRGRHIGPDDTLERWQLRMLDRFRRRV